MSGATLPVNLEAERAVLGAILVDNLALDVAQQAGLVETAFFRVAHQRLYRVFVALAARRCALDAVTVIDELQRAGDLDEVGPAYLSALLSDGLRSANVAHYVALVQEYATRRALIHLARGVIEQAAAGEESAPAVLDGAVRGLLDIGAQTQRGELVESDRTAADVVAYLDELMTRRQDRQVAGVSTGFRELDDMLDGFQPGHLVIVAGRTSEGKSSLALQCAIASESCAFFSCEMERMELAVRQLAVLGRVDGWALRRGYLSSGEQVRLQQAMTRLAESGVAIDDTPAISVSEVRAKARRRQVTRGLRLVVVDYLQLMAAETSKRRETTREQEVAGIARALKALAKELRVPVLALSQFSRALKPGETPELHHLRESGELEQAANVVLMIHRKDGQTVATEGDVDVIVAKNRGGRKGTVTLRWYPSETRFGELATVDEPRQGAFA